MILYSSCLIKQFKMTLPTNKATTPFKTMDIKTALLSGGTRKRKSISQAPKDEPKSKKPSVENGDHENDVEILEEACGITVVLQPSETDSALGDCKENKDINAAKAECPQDNSKDNKLLSPSKEEKSTNLDKKSCDILTFESSKTPKLVSDNDIELLSDKSKKSDDSSCDEPNTSVNVSLNTSELSITGEDNDKEHNTQSKVKDEVQNKSDGKGQTDKKEKVKKRRMTPAEAKKRAEEREQKQKEKLLKKQELENKKRERQLEKEQQLKEKMLKKEREEFERQERERIKQEKKEQEEKERLKKQKEKEEKAKLKQMQLEQKLNEKKMKEEMKLKKEEELKKAEEEKQRAKLEKEQKEKEKQARAKAAFVKFFVKSENNTPAPPAQISEKGAFLPFQVSDDMTLAPVVPPAAQERFDRKQLDLYLKLQDGKKLYIDILKSGAYKDVRQRKKNKKLEDSDVIIIDQNAQAELGLNPKLLQFHENVRPPYWGTWRKKSKNIRPRNPFGQDEMFDYDVDSDDEWDEGGPGESLSGTENEDESEDDYEVDNEFFVPHGYLSDEEEKKEDDDEEVNDPEKQKALLKLKLQEFEMERKKKTTELKPVILGCYFANHPAFKDCGLQMFLQDYSAEFLTDTPIPTSFTVKSQQSGSGNNTAESPKSNNNNSAKKKNVQSFPEKAFPDLIRLVHGNIKNKRILAEEFQRFWLEQSGEKSEVKQDSVDPSNSESVPCKDGVDGVPSDSSQISLSRLYQTIRDIASYGKSPDTSFNKCCWWVHDVIREKYGLLDAPIPNQWKYVLQKETEPPAKNNSASIKGFFIFKLNVLLLGNFRIGL